MDMDWENVPEDMLDQPIQPWRPKIGDHVRVSGGAAECRQPWAKGSLFDRHGMVGHDPNEVGQTGKIFAIDAIVPSHPFWVQLDRAIALCGEETTTWRCINYAACELEPLA